MFKAVSVPTFSHLGFSHVPTAPLFLTWSVVNSVHWWSGSTQALPATTVLLLLGAWVLVGFPLTVIGGIMGKNRAGSFQAPCRTRNIPRQIPTQPWYKHTAVHMAIGGFLPFRLVDHVWKSGALIKRNFNRQKCYLLILNE